MQFKIFVIEILCYGKKGLDLIFVACYITGCPNIYFINTRELRARSLKNWLYNKKALTRVIRLKTII